MKRKEKYLLQYSYETKNILGDIDEFLDSIAPEIGYLIFDFNTLEETLTELLCMLINDRSSSPGLIITLGMNYSTKVILLKRYLEHAQSIARQVIDFHQNMMMELQECGRLRNMVVHADWETGDLDSYTLVKVKIKKGKIIQEYIQFDLASLKNIRARIRSLTNKLCECEQEFYNLFKR